jgi:hypothetical protein
MRTRRPRASRSQVDQRRLRMEDSNTRLPLLPAEVVKSHTADSAWAHCFMDATEAVLSLKHLRRALFRPEEWRYTTRMRPPPLHLLQLARLMSLALTSTTPL